MHPLSSFSLREGVVVKNFRKVFDAVGDSRNFTSVRGGLYCREGVGGSHNVKGKLLSCFSSKPFLKQLVFYVSAMLQMKFLVMKFLSHPS